MTPFQRLAALAALFCSCVCAGTPVIAAEAHGAPYFAVQGDGSVDRLPLLQTSAAVDIVGPIAAVTHKQTIATRGAATIEAAYVFPASDRAAVSGLTMRIGDRIVEAELHERSEAKRTYEAAKETGHIARRPDFERAIATLFFGNDATPRIEASRDYVAFRTGLDARGREVSERAELPYVAIVTRADIADASARSELRQTLEQRWLHETGQPPGADLVMRDIPVEVRQPVSAASVTSARIDAPNAALLAALRDRGLRRDQLRWTREDAMNVGRAKIVTLAPIAEVWVRDAGR